MLLIDEFSKNSKTNNNILVLTHAHIDHLKDLSKKNVRDASVHCTPVTYYLLHDKYPFLTPTFTRMNIVYHLQEEISVVPIENGHCSGSLALFHVETKILWWGDGRFEKTENIPPIVRPLVICYDGTFIRKSFLQPSLNNSETLVRTFLTHMKAPCIYIKHFGQIRFLKSLEDDFYFDASCNDDACAINRICNATLIKKSMIFFESENKFNKKKIVVTCKKVPNCLVLSALWFIIHEEVPKNTFVYDNETCMYRIYLSAHASEEDLENMRKHFPKVKLVDVTKHNTHEII